MAKPDAVAAMVVDPGVKVESNFATANVSPERIVIVGSRVPTLVNDDDKLMVVSSIALAGLELESCSCTKTHS